MNKLLRNPFYALALLVGLLFTITVCVDAALIVKTNATGNAPRRGEPGFALLDLLDRHGTKILAGELAALGICTVAAIRLDHVRGRREFAKRNQQNEC